MRILTLVLLAGLAAGAQAASSIGGTFIQLNREAGALDRAGWEAQLDKIKAAGLDTVIIQWSAEGPIAYFSSDAWPAAERMPAVGHILAAAADRQMSVFVGLENDPGYWTQITARDRVLRDYFLARVARAEQLQKALLGEFGKAPAWKGYYIPDELDDLNWRADNRRALLRDYLATLGGRLRANDAKRLVAVSAFFRGRTAPDIFARLLADLTAGKERSVDAVLVQDGVGVGDPPARYVGLYFESMRKNWPRKGPELWGILETFEQTSGEGQPFVAKPAAGDRLRVQRDAVAPHVDRLVLFTLLDYADPARGAAPAALYEAIKALR